MVARCCENSPLHVSILMQTCAAAWRPHVCTQFFSHLFAAKIFGHKNDIMAIMVFLFEVFPAVKPNRKATKLQSLDSSYIMPHPATPPLAPPWMQHEVAKGLGMFKNRRRQHILIMPWSTVGASVADGWIRHQNKLSYWVSISGYDPWIGNAGHSKPNLNLAVGTRLAWVPCRLNRFFQPECQTPIVCSTKVSWSCLLFIAFQCRIVVCSSTNW